MKKLLVLALFLIACQTDLHEDGIMFSQQGDSDAIALVFDTGAKVSTTSSDPFIQRMTQGFPIQNCQWQTLYFIGHGVVRIDKVMLASDVEMLDWVTINNDLTKEYYKVYYDQVLVNPEVAVQSGKKLQNGWEWGVIQYNNYKIGVAYLQVPNSSFVQVSFVKFTKYK